MTDGSLLATFRSIGNTGAAFAFGLIDEFVELNVPVKSEAFLDFGEEILTLLNIETEMVQGPQLKALLSEAYRRVLTVKEAANLIDQIRSLAIASANDEWSAAGYGTEGEYFNMLRPFGFDRSTCFSLIAFYEKTLPRIQKVFPEYEDPLGFFINVPKSTLIKIGRLYAMPGLDGAGVGLITRWAERGGMTSELIGQLVTSTLFTGWSVFADRLRKAGLDPLQVCLSLGPCENTGAKENDISGPERTQALARFLAYAEITDEALVQLVTEIPDMPVEAVRDYLDNHHGRKEDHLPKNASFPEDDEGGPAASKPIEGSSGRFEATPNDIVYDDGADDRHTPLILKVKDTGNGYITVIGGAGSSRMLADLLRKYNIVLQDENGQELIFRNAKLAPKDA